MMTGDADQRASDPQRATSTNSSIEEFSTSLQNAIHPAASSEDPFSAQGWRLFPGLGALEAAATDGSNSSSYPSRNSSLGGVGVTGSGVPGVLSQGPRPYVSSSGGGSWGTDIGPGGQRLSRQDSIPARYAMRPLGQAQQGGGADGAIELCPNSGTCLGSAGLSSTPAPEANHQAAVGVTSMSAAEGEGGGRLRRTRKAPHHSLSELPPPGISAGAEHPWRRHCANPLYGSGNSSGGGAAGSVDGDSTGGHAGFHIGPRQMEALGEDVTAGAATSTAMTDVAAPPPSRRRARPLEVMARSIDAEGVSHVSGGGAFPRFGRDEPETLQLPLSSPAQEVSAAPSVSKPSFAARQPAAVAAPSVEVPSERVANGGGTATNDHKSPPPPHQVAGCSSRFPSDGSQVCAAATDGHGRASTSAAAIAPNGLAASGSVAVASAPVTAQSSSSSSSARDGGGRRGGEGRDGAMSAALAFARNDVSPSREAAGRAELAGGASTDLPTGPADASRVAKIGVTNRAEMRSGEAEATEGGVNAGTARCGVAIAASALADEAGDCWARNTISVPGAAVAAAAVVAEEHVTEVRSATATALRQCRSALQLLSADLTVRLRTAPSSPSSDRCWCCYRCWHDSHPRVVSTVPASAGHIRQTVLPSELSSLSAQVEAVSLLVSAAPYMTSASDTEDGPGSANSATSESLWELSEAILAAVDRGRSRQQRPAEQACMLAAPLAQLADALSGFWAAGAAAGTPWSDDRLAERLAQGCAWLRESCLQSSLPDAAVALAASRRNDSRHVSAKEEISCTANVAAATTTAAELATSAEGASEVAEAPPEEPAPTVTMTEAEATGRTELDTNPSRDARGGQRDRAPRRPASAAVLGGDSSTTFSPAKRMKITVATSTTEIALPPEVTVASRPAALGDIPAHAVPTAPYSGCEDASNNEGRDTDSRLDTGVGGSGTREEQRNGFFQAAKQAEKEKELSRSLCVAREAAPPVLLRPQPPASDPKATSPRQSQYNQKERGEEEGVRLHESQQEEVHPNASLMGAAGYAQASGKDAPPLLPPPALPPPASSTPSSDDAVDGYSPVEVSGPLAPSAPTPRTLIEATSAHQDHHGQQLPTVPVAPAAAVHNHEADPPPPKQQEQLEEHQQQQPTQEASDVLEAPAAANPAVHAPKGAPALPFMTQVNRAQDLLREAQGLMRPLLPDSTVVLLAALPGPFTLTTPAAASASPASGAGRQKQEVAPATESGGDVIQQILYRAGALAQRVVDGHEYGGDPPATATSNGEGAAAGVGSSACAAAAVVAVRVQLMRAVLALAAEDRTAATEAVAAADTLLRERLLGGAGGGGYEVAGLRAEAVALRGAVREVRGQLYIAMRLYDEALELCLPTETSARSSLPTDLLLLRAALAAARARCVVRLSALIPFAVSAGGAGLKAGQVDPATPADPWVAPWPLPWYALATPAAAPDVSGPAPRHEQPQSGPLLPSLALQPCPRVKAAAVAALDYVAVEVRGVCAALAASGSLAPSKDPRGAAASAAPPPMLAALAEVSMILVRLKLMAAAGSTGSDSAAAGAAPPLSPTALLPSPLALQHRRTRIRPEKGRLVHEAAALAGSALRWLLAAASPGTSSSSSWSSGLPGAAAGQAMAATPLAPRHAECALLAAVCVAATATPVHGSGVAAAGPLGGFVGVSEGGAAAGQAAAALAAQLPRRVEQAGAAAATTSEEGPWDLAWNWAKWALTRRQEMYGVDSGAALDVQAFLAHVSGWGQGLWYVAEPLLVSVVALRGEALGPAHPSTQAAAAYYLDLLLQHNRLRSAENVLRRLMPRALAHQRQLHRQRREKQQTQQQQQRETQTRDELAKSERQKQQLAAKSLAAAPAVATGSGGGPVPAAATPPAATSAPPPSPLPIQALQRRLEDIKRHHARPAPPLPPPPLAAANELASACPVEPPRSQPLTALPQPSAHGHSTLVAAATATVAVPAASCPAVAGTSHAAAPPATAVTAAVMVVPSGSSGDVAQLKGPEESHAAGLQTGRTVAEGQQPDSGRAAALAAAPAAPGPLGATAAASPAKAKAGSPAQLPRKIPMPQQSPAKQQLQLLQPKAVAEEAKGALSKAGLGMETAAIPFQRRVRAVLQLSTSADDGKKVAEVAVASKLQPRAAAPAQQQAQMQVQPVQAGTAGPLPEACRDRLRAGEVMVKIRGSAPQQVAAPATAGAPPHHPPQTQLNAFRRAAAALRKSAEAMDLPGATAAATAAAQAKPTSATAAVRSSTSAITATAQAITTELAPLRSSTNDLQRQPQQLHQQRSAAAVASTTSAMDAPPPPGAADEKADATAASVLQSPQPTSLKEVAAAFKAGMAAGSPQTRTPGVNRRGAGGVAKPGGVLRSPMSVVVASPPTAEADPVPDRADGAAPSQQQQQLNHAAAVQKEVVGFPAAAAVDKDSVRPAEVVAKAAKVKLSGEPAPPGTEAVAGVEAPAAAAKAAAAAAIKAASVAEVKAEVEAASGAGDAAKAIGEAGTTQPVLKERDVVKVEAAVKQDSAGKARGEAKARRASGVQVAVEAAAKAAETAKAVAAVEAAETAKAAMPRMESATAATEREGMAKATEPAAKAEAAVKLPHAAGGVAKAQVAAKATPTVVTRAKDKATVKAAAAGETAAKTREVVTNHEVQTAAAPPAGAAPLAAVAGATAAVAAPPPAGAGAFEAANEVQLVTRAGKVEKVSRPVRQSPQTKASPPVNALGGRPGSGHAASVRGGSAAAAPGVSPLHTTSPKLAPATKSAAAKKQQPAGGPAPLHGAPARPQNSPPQPCQSQSGDAVLEARQTLKQVAATLQTQTQAVSDGAAPQQQPSAVVSAAPPAPAAPAPVQSLLGASAASTAAAPSMNAAALLDVLHRPHCDQPSKQHQQRSQHQQQAAPPSLAAAISALLAAPTPSPVAASSVSRVSLPSPVPFRLETAEDTAPAEQQPYTAGGTDSTPLWSGGELILEYGEEYDGDTADGDGQGGALQPLPLPDEPPLASLLQRTPSPSSPSSAPPSPPPSSLLQLTHSDTLPSPLQPRPSPVDCSVPTPQEPLPLEPPPPLSYMQEPLPYMQDPQPSAMPPSVAAPGSLASDSTALSWTSVAGPVPPVGAPEELSAGVRICPDTDISMHHVSSLRGLGLPRLQVVRAPDTAADERDSGGVSYCPSYSWSPLASGDSPAGASEAEEAAAAVAKAKSFASGAAAGLAEAPPLLQAQAPLQQPAAAVAWEGSASWRRHAEGLGPAPRPNGGGGASSRGLKLRPPPAGPRRLPERPPWEGLPGGDAAAAAPGPAAAALVGALPPTGPSLGRSRSRSDASARAAAGCNGGLGQHDPWVGAGSRRRTADAFPSEYDVTAAACGEGPGAVTESTGPSFNEGHTNRAAVVVGGELGVSTLMARAEAAAGALAATAAAAADMAPVLEGSGAPGGGPHWEGPQLEEALVEFGAAVVVVARIPTCAMRVKAPVDGAAAGLQVRSEHARKVPAAAAVAAAPAVGSPVHAAVALGQRPVA